MLGNFFKVAFRVFIRNRVLTLINITGLSLGIAFSIIIFLYAYKELSYDRFHKNSPRIFRIAVNAQIAENRFNIAMTSTPLARAMLKEIPDVENTVRIARFGAWLLQNDSIKYNEDNIIFSDPSFFKVFSFPLIKGSPENVLSKPNSIVLTEKAARRYFGNTDPLGKLLQVENDTTFYEVTGIMKDVPDNSHMQFDMIGALSTFNKMIDNDRWVVNYLYTYFLCKEECSLKNIQKGLDLIAKKYVIPDYHKLLNREDQTISSGSDYYNFIIQPLTDIHLQSHYTSELEPSGKLIYIYLFVVLAILILLLSCVNFINLITSNSVDRAIEVGIRKISGSERYSLIKQFLLESSILAFISLTFGLLLTELALPAFSKYIGLNLNLNELLNSAGLILLITLIIIIGLISGIYPALRLSSFNPVSVLYKRNFIDSEKGYFKKGVTIFQLFLAIGALSMTLVTMKQYNYLINRDRGYITDNLIVIRRPDALTNKLQQFKNEIRKNPDILAVANATSAMGGGFSRFPYYLNGTPATNNFSASTLFLSHGFDSTYLIKMASGRFFDRSVPEDSFACIINETAARQMNLSNPLGKTLIQLSGRPGKSSRYKIIGVVKDFCFETLENPIRPLIMILMPGNYEGYMTVRVKPGNINSTVNYLQTVWESYTNVYPFVFYELNKDRYDYYKPVRTTARIFIMLSIVTILMSCLSLFALVSFLYNKKHVEIGIQKAMGASNLILLMKRTGEIISLVLLASFGAWTGVYFLAKQWLNDYAFHININFLYFITASMIIFLFSAAAVYYHTYISVSANASKVLKYE